MPIPLAGVLVLVASPGDATEERAIVRDAPVDWNVNRGRRERVALLPWLWERHAVARIGDRPQAIVNAQAVDSADAVVAFFDSRLGTATGVDVSGTAEEINRAIELGKPVHVYFSGEPLPRDVDPEQLVLLDEFKEGLQSRGLLGNYSDPADLAGQVVRALESDIAELAWASSAASQPSETGNGAILTWEHIHDREQHGLDKRGKVQYRTLANELLVRNDGDVAAEDLTFKLTAVGDTAFAFPKPPSDPVTVYPHSSLSWPLIPTPSLNQSGSTVQVTSRWVEGSEQREEVRTVYLKGGA